MIDRKNLNKEKETIEPNWYGSGKELFDAIQAIKDKEIHIGYLETDLDFEFSDAFKYPLVFEIKSSDSVVESIAIAFDISKKNKTKWTIDEKVIVPEVCNTITREDFINYLADVVKKGINFAFYIDKKPSKFEKLNFHVLTNKQRIVFNEHLVLAIKKLLDKRKEIT